LIELIELIDLRLVVTAKKAKALGCAIESRSIWKKS